MEYATHLFDGQLPDQEFHGCALRRLASVTLVRLDGCYFGILRTSSETTKFVFNLGETTRFAFDLGEIMRNYVIKFVDYVG